MAKQKPPKLAAVEPPHADGWSNALSGIGTTTKDKTAVQGLSLSVLRFTQFDLEAIWRMDDIFARIVEAVPDEMLREGGCVQVEGDKDLSEATDTALSDFGMVEALRKALYFERAYGGSAILLGADDGQKNLARPLNEEGIRSFKWLSVLSPLELTPRQYYTDMGKPKYGEVEIWQFNPIWAPPGAAPAVLPLIHESRLIRFGGIELSRRQTMEQLGWGDSLLTRILKIITDFQGAWGGAAILFQDFAVPVFKMAGLAKILQSAKSGDQTLASRAAALEMCRSIARVLIIDKEEDFKRETTNVTGLPEMLDKLMLRLASAAKMPVSLLMGQAPAGLNATGDSDIRWWYDQISAKQEQAILKPIKRMVSLTFKSQTGPGEEPESWDYVFNPLWQLTAKEEADIRYVQAQADALYLANQVVLPEEIAQSRFGGDTYSTETHIDMDVRAKMAAAPHEEAMQRLGAPDPAAEEMKQVNLQAAKAALNDPKAEEKKNQGSPAPSDKIKPKGKWVFGRWVPGAG